MQAFHNDPKIKARVLNQVLNHQKLDQIIKGKYWENGKGCAIGCTVHSDDHGAYEKELGIPRILARLEDGIFEGLPNEKALLWPVQFLEAIEIGKDLSLVWPRFAVWMLTDEKDGVIKYAKPDGKKAIQKISDMYASLIDGAKIKSNDWIAARNAAHAYAAYAADAADAAAYAAYAASAATTAAAAPAYAAYAAYAATTADAAAAAHAYAAYAADAAAYAAYAATTAAAAAAAHATEARKKIREQMRVVQSEKLLELLKGA